MPWKKKKSFTSIISINPNLQAQLSNKNKRLDEKKIPWSPRLDVESWKDSISNRLFESEPCSRLFTFHYFTVLRSSRWSALRYSLQSCMSVKKVRGGRFGRKLKCPTPAPGYIWKSRWPPLMVRRAISWRSQGKIGDCMELINYGKAKGWFSLATKSESES